MGRIIGIDLGTTNSVAAYWARKRPKVIENDVTRSYIIPSAVTVNEFGQRVVGQDAKDRLGSGSTNVIYSIKRFMGMDYDDPKTQEALSNIGYGARKAENGEVEVLLDGKYYSPVEISAMTLQQLKSDAELQLGEAVTHAVITVPAYFGQRQKDATREAGRLAGLRVARIINEPTAAALAFGVENDTDEAKYVLVYDLGGGTFDVSILLVSGQTYDIFNIDGDNFLGGDNFDNYVAERVLSSIRGKALHDDKVALSILKYRAEQAKIELSRTATTRILDSFQSSSGHTVNVDLTLERSELEDMIAPEIEKSIEIVHRAIEGAHLELDDISHVLLVGGSTRIPLVRRKLKALFGADKVEIDVDPMQCVALGAAVQTAAISRDELAVEALGITEITGIDAADAPVITITDVTSKYIGIETEDDSKFAVIIEKGTVFPTATPYKREFYTSRFDQRTYTLPVYEVEASTVEDAERKPLTENEHIGLIENDRLSPGLPPRTPVIVEMTIDHDGILRVSSYVKNDKDKTFIEKSLKFVGHRSSDNKDVFGNLGFVASMLETIAQSPRLRKYLKPGQADTAMQLLARAKPVLEAKNQVQAETLVDEMQELMDDFPAPTVSLFWASLVASDQKNFSAVERNQTQQLVVQMEQAIGRDDVDTANIHLRHLNDKLSEMVAKIPHSNLLRKS